MITYACKRGTMPYACVKVTRPLVVGDKIYVPSMDIDGVVRGYFNSKHNYVMCNVDRVDEGRIFISYV